MDYKTFQTLLTPLGQEAILVATEFLPREVDFLSHYQSLSRLFPPDIARGALETAILRLEGQTKFPFADSLYFTREALEQTTSWEIAHYRAQRYQPFHRVLDLGCSIGGDSMALAETTDTIGIDRDSLRLAMAYANMTALSLLDRIDFIQADIANTLPFFFSRYAAPTSTALFFDPARRVQNRRVYSVNDYQPPLSIIHGWLPKLPGLGVKISPGVFLHELEDYDAEIEFISLHGNLKEAVLWFGPLKTSRFRATLLPGPHTFTSDLSPSELAKQKLPISEPQAHLFEPDPAILRAGLVVPLGERIGAYQLDEDIAYLTASRSINTPFAKSWAIETWFPFGLKRLRAYLREKNVGRVTVKKRGSPLQPERLIRDLRLNGERERVVFLTHLRGKAIVIVCFPR